MSLTVSQWNEGELSATTSWTVKSPSCSSIGCRCVQCSSAYCCVPLAHSTSVPSLELLWDSGIMASSNECVVYWTWVSELRDYSCPSLAACTLKESQQRDCSLSCNRGLVVAESERAVAVIYGSWPPLVATWWAKRSLSSPLFILQPDVGALQAHNHHYVIRIHCLLLFILQ